MDEATIGDGFTTLYRFTWGDVSRTTDEPWMTAALANAEDATLDDVVEAARADDECEVEILGFEAS